MNRQTRPSLGHSGWILLLGLLPVPGRASDVSDRIPPTADYLDRLGRLGFSGVVLIAQGYSTFLA